jgi:hypothetical protein
LKGKKDVKCGTKTPPWWRNLKKYGECVQHLKPLADYFFALLFSEVTFGNVSQKEPCAEGP